MISCNRPARIQTGVSRTGRTVSAGFIAFLSSLFNDTLSMSDYIASNGRMIGEQ
jgi:hypothetical protein